MKKYKDDSQLESDSLYRNQNIEKDYVAIGRFINKCFELKINIDALPTILKNRPMKKERGHT